MSDSKYFIALIAIIVVAVVMLGVGPILSIMALNTLFGLNIAYTFGTWLSMCWVNLTTFGGLSLAIKSLKQK